jgi:hypothetical protein
MPTTNHPIAGRVHWSYGGGGKLVLSSAWVAENIGTVYIPQLDGVPTYGGKFSGNVRFYKRAIPQLKAAFAAVEAAGLTNKILFWDGSFVPRLKRGGSTPSNHTFGTAFDINAEWNGFRVKPAGKGRKGDLHGIAAIFKQYGFEWGGDWQRVPDGMHFEISRILNDVKAVEPAAPAVATVPPSIVVSITENGKTTNTRIPAHKEKDVNFAPAQKLLQLAGVPYQVGKWGDGTPCIKITK